MFANNQKLSLTGIRKLIISEELGLIILFVMYFSSQLDILTGAITLTGIFSLSGIYLSWILARKDKKPFPYFLWRFKLKSFLMGIFTLLLLLRYTREYLLPGTNILLPASACFLCTAVLSCNTIEFRGRLAEFLYPFIIFFWVASLLYQLIILDYSQVFSTFSDALLPNYPLSFNNICKMLLLIFFSFFILCPWRYLITDTPIYHQYADIKNELFKLSFILYLMAMIQFIMLKITYPSNPVITITISMLLSITVHMYYGRKLTNVKKNYFFGFGFFALLLFLFIPSTLKHWHIYNYFSDTDFDSMYQSGEPFIDATEIEQRSFVLSMIISQKKQQPAYICEIATPSDRVSTYVSISDFEDYTLQTGLTLDFSHIKAILFSDKISYNKQKLLMNLAKKYEMSEKTLVFQQKNFPDIYDTLLSDLENICLGEVLERIAKDSDTTFQNTLYYLSQ